MKTRIQKALAVLLAVSLVFSMAVTVLGGPFDPGNLGGRDPDREVSLTLHHRVLADGTIIPGDPIGTPQPNPLGDPVEGATWRLYRLDPPVTWDQDMASVDDDWWEYIGTEVTDVDGEAFWDNLEQGFFRVVNTFMPDYDCDYVCACVGACNYDCDCDTGDIHANVYVQIPLFIRPPAHDDYDCECPGADVDPELCDRYDDFWLYDVHVFTKQTTTPYFGKTVNSYGFCPCDCDPADFCDYACVCPGVCDYDCDCECDDPSCRCDCTDGCPLVINWEFEIEIRPGLGTIPNLCADSSTPGGCLVVGTCYDCLAHIRVTDVLDTRLLLVADSMYIVFDVAGGETRLLPAAYWDLRIVYTTVLMGTETVVEEQTLIIDILEDGRDYIYEHGLRAGSIRIRFGTSVRIIEDSPFYHDRGEIENDGTLNYSRNPDYELGEGDVPSVTVFELTVIKICNDDDDPDTLEGAVFYLYREEDIGADGRPLDGAIPVAISGPTGADGVARFFPLPAGVFYLYEVVSPSGFRRVTVAQRVEINETITEACDGDPCDYTKTIEFVNFPGFDLPMTGGAGTIMFTIGGLGLIGGAVSLLLFAPKKKGKKEQTAA